MEGNKVNDTDPDACEIIQGWGPGQGCSKFMWGGGGGGGGGGGELHEAGVI